MFLLVLRLLAVYFGTAAAGLWLAHRFVTPVRFRVAILLALGPFLLVGKALVTAGVHAPVDIAYQAPPLSTLAAAMGTQVTQTRILSDVAFQEIPWRKAVREAAGNGRLPLWNRFVLAGEPLLATQQPAVFHPGTWIGFLLPLAQAWTFEMALRYFLALLAAYLFLEDLGCGEIAALTGSAAWAFCDYLVFYLGYPLTPAAAPFPLLLLGLRRLARRQDRRAVALTVIALLLILTSGHPETLLHAVAGGGVYFLFELGLAGRGRRRRPFLLSLLAGVLALSLSAVLLLPLAEALPRTMEHFMRRGYFAHVRKSFPPYESLRQAATGAMPFLFGVSGKGEAAPAFAEPSSYSGAVLWPFAVAGLFSRRREKWPLLVLGLLGAAMGARVLGVADVVSALPLFDIGLNDRMIFLAAFGAAGLAALGLEASREESGRHAAVSAAVGGAALLTLLYVLRLRHNMALLNMPPGYFRYRFLLQLVPLALATGLWLALRRRGRPELAAAAVLVLLLAQRGLEERGVYPTYPSRAFYPPLRILDPIPRAAPDRMTAVGLTFIPNIAALYELEDVRGYEAMTFRPLVETYPLWCVPQPIWYNRVDDPTTPFLSFLNVRYVLTPPGHPPPAGWKILSRGEEGSLLENPGALPRAFVPKSLLYEPEAGRRIEILRSIRDFADQGVIGQAPPVVSAAPQPNGRAVARIASYEPQQMTLDIEAKEPAVIATSVIAWPGWRLAVDGEKTPFLSYNHAFLGFRVAGGRHTAVVRYLPASFLAGSAISAATLLFGLLVLRRPRVALPAARAEWPAPVDIADRVAVESSENRRAVGASAGPHAVPAAPAQRFGGAMAKRELD